MAEQKLIISATTPDGLDASKTISNFNPEASNAQLAQLGQKLTAFTDNTYGKTDRVIKYNCDTESGGSKLTPTFTLNKTTDTKANVCAGQNGFVSYTINYTYDGDGQIFIHPDENAGGIGVSIYRPTNQLNICSIFSPAQTLNGITQNAVITFRTTETDTYKAAEATFTITVQEG